MKDSILDRVAAERAEVDGKWLTVARLTSAPYSSARPLPFHLGEADLAEVGFCEVSETWLSAAVLLLLARLPPS